MSLMMSFLLFRSAFFFLLIIRVFLELGQGRNRLPDGNFLVFRLFLVPFSFDASIGLSAGKGRKFTERCWLNWFESAPFWGCLNLRLKTRRICFQFAPLSTERKAFSFWDEGPWIGCFSNCRLIWEIYLLLWLKGTKKSTDLVCNKAGL